MAREVLPRELLVRIVSSFEAYLPNGVFLALRGDERLDVRSANGGGWFGEPLGAVASDAGRREVATRRAVGV
jgi:hypothetical protein